MAYRNPSDQAEPRDSTVTPLDRWEKARLILKVVELRLRFVALMAVTGLAFAYWDELANRYEKWMRPATEHVETASGTEYYCPMHPQVVQAQAGSCPICGMPLARRKVGHKEPLPAGVTARVALAPFRVAQAGIATVEVDYAPLSQTLTTVGYVDYDERRLANIISKVPGRSRVEKLHVNVTGQGVEVGQTLAELYNPELSQAVQELLNAHRRVTTSTAPRSDVARALIQDRQALVHASTEKLRRWGITDRQIDQILRSGTSTFTVPILSSLRGTVVRKNVVEGQEVPEGLTMFEVADLRSVWVQAQVFEGDLDLIHLGQPVEATVEAFPDKTFTGKVELIQPEVDPSTRTIKVRYALDNPGVTLRPGMFATVTLKTAVARTAAFQRHSATPPEAQTVRVSRNTTVEEQRICPVTDAELGTMGPPIAVEVKGRKIWTCCDACPPKINAHPTTFLAKLAPLATPAETDHPRALKPSEQKNCPVTGAKLGSMGDPVLVALEGREVWTCCKACPPKMKADPGKYLARLATPRIDEVLSVPEEAVIDTGTRKIVYIETAPGVFDGREVVLGRRVGNRYPVLDGLSPGERVAASGAFLIDAESRLNPGVAGGKESRPSSHDHQQPPSSEKPPSHGAEPHARVSTRAAARSVPTRR